MFKRLVVMLVCSTFSLGNLQFAQAQPVPQDAGDFSINQLPVPGTMVGVTTPFEPLALKGLIVDPQKPLEFQFIVDTGRGPQDTASIKNKASELIKYFLAGLTIPEGNLWVNLSPYEKDRMVPQALGQTDLGRDLLAQDYILKQLTASLIYPEKELGKKFWGKVYAKAQQEYGTTDVPVNTFNKVWILPNEAQVFENGNAAYVTKSTLKVMLDEDYTALKKHQLPSTGRINTTHSIASNIVRSIILPEIEKEVNSGKNFAPLRQIYQALILAKWYKETIQNGILDAVYTNRSKVLGVNLDDPYVKDQIYERYLRAYKKGVFNYIKEEPVTLSPNASIGDQDHTAVSRKYFSGGTEMYIQHLDPNGAMTSVKANGPLVAMKVSLLETLRWQWARPWWPRVSRKLIASLTLTTAIVLQGCASYNSNDSNSYSTSKGPTTITQEPQTPRPAPYYPVIKPIVPYKEEHPVYRPPPAPTHLNPPPSPPRINRSNHAMLIPDHNFDLTVKSRWDQMREAGLATRNPDEYKAFPVGDWITVYSPANPLKSRVLPIDQRKDVRQPKAFGFRFIDRPKPNNEPDNIMFESNIGTESVRLRFNNGPQLPNHFLVMPEYEQGLTQLIRGQDIRTLLELSSRSRPEDHLVFIHNSFGAGAVVNQLHIHGIYNPGTLAIENAQQIPYIQNQGLTVSTLEGFVVPAFVFEGERVLVVEAAGRFLKTFQRGNQSYNVIVIGQKVYIIPRQAEAASIDGSNYDIGGLELAGRLELPTEQLAREATLENIQSWLRPTGVGLNKFEQLKELVKKIANSKIYVEHVRGSVGDMLVRSSVSKTSNLGVIYLHGMGGDLNNKVGEWLEDLPVDTTTVRYSSSRFKPKPSHVNFGWVQEMYGDNTVLGNHHIKTFFNEMDDLRSVIAYTIKKMKETGGQHGPINLVLVGESLGGMIVPIIAREFPEVKGIVSIAGSMQPISSSNVNADVRHPVVWDMYGQQRIQIMFKEFTGRSLIIQTSEDFPARNVSSNLWRNFAGGPIEYATVPGPHNINESGPDTKLAMEEHLTSFINTVTAENPAMITSNESSDVGGIDLNQIRVHRTGKVINVQFDPAQLNELMQDGFEGFTPEIISYTPISSPLPLLGLGPAKEEELAKL